MKKNILVTGASSGFGLLVANALHKQGFHVIGTSRNPEKYAAKFPFKMIALDLDSEQSIVTFQERLFREIPQLDILINNAGFLVSGIAEEIPVELGRKQFETNFWGTIKVTNAVLPSFRKQKFGKIITVGSIVGLVSFPNAAYYAANPSVWPPRLSSRSRQVVEVQVRQRRRHCPRTHRSQIPQRRGRRTPTGSRTLVVFRVDFIAMGTSVTSSIRRIRRGPSLRIARRSSRCPPSRTNRPRTRSRLTLQPPTRNRQTRNHRRPSTKSIFRSYRRLRRDGV